MEKNQLRSELHWPAFLARILLGLLFLMAGWTKVFEMGAIEHARQLFVEGYKDYWIPVWLLWFSGFVIPFVELISGALLVMGYRVRESLFALGIVLIVVTYGHLLKEPFYDITTHILPRAILVIFLFSIPRNADTVTIDSVLNKRKLSK